VAIRRKATAHHPLRTIFHAGSFAGLTDGQLLERFVTGQGEAADSAFGAIIERHGRIVLSVCKSVLREHHAAQDAFQATFLVLMRKASSLWVRESLGPWLHRVAFRVAMHARRNLRRRQRAEREAAERTSWQTEAVAFDDVASIVHEEVEQLPERYRVPVVLCDLEGRSYEDAARHVGCPVGTVKSRLARGRADLRRRLIQRGVAPPTVAVSSALSSAIARADVPAALASDTISLAIGDALAPAPVAILARHAMRALIMRMPRTIATILAVVGLASAGVASWSVATGQTQRSANPPKENAADSTRRPRETSSSAESNPSHAPTENHPIRGNWIVRAIQNDRPMALVSIDPREPHVRVSLLSTNENYRLEDSRIEDVRVTQREIHFTLRLKPKTEPSVRRLMIDAYLPSAGSAPRLLFGSMGDGRRLPAELERTDRRVLDPKKTSTPALSNDELTRLDEARDVNERRALLEAILRKSGDGPNAVVPAWLLAITLADTKASKADVRAATDRAIRLASRFGPEMERGTIDTIVHNIVGSEGLADVVLDYARKAESMLRPTDSVADRTIALTNLAKALRKAGKRNEAEAVEARLAKLSPSTSTETTVADRIPWADSFASATQEASANGKLIMVDFVTTTCSGCKRLDTHVFPNPAVVAATRAFVPVKVNADDGEGRPLADRYATHTRKLYPTILLIDPDAEKAGGNQVVGKIWGYVPPTSFADRLQRIARFPRNLATLREQHKTNPASVDALPLLVAALAMQGGSTEAVTLAKSARAGRTDQASDGWAAAYTILGEQLLFGMKPAEAADWFGLAAQAAKRPVDRFNAHLDAGFAMAFQGKADVAARELEAAARVVELPRGDRAFAQERLEELATPRNSLPSVKEAVEALKRLEADGLRATLESANAPAIGRSSESK
jgi:RNA polymerase sigma factor (sigma-70 family)